MQWVERLGNNGTNEDDEGNNEEEEGVEVEEPVYQGRLVRDTSVNLRTNESQLSRSLLQGTQILRRAYCFSALFTAKV